METHTFSIKFKRILNGVNTPCSNEKSVMNHRIHNNKISKLNSKNNCKNTVNTALILDDAFHTF